MVALFLSTVRLDAFYLVFFEVFFVKNNTASFQFWNRDQLRGHPKMTFTNPNGISNGISNIFQNFTPFLMKLGGVMAIYYVFSQILSQKFQFVNIFFP